MKINLYINKSVQENAAQYYEEAKEIKAKIEGVGKAIEETKKELQKAEKEEASKKSKVKIKKEKIWYQKFNCFFTSENKLVVGGRNAQQNDILFSKHMESTDLFFHADIQGGSAIILKDGSNATEHELIETAQFAASLSNAWKNANASVDVYCVKKEQLAKHAHGGYIATGAFAITGERKWFKSTKLGVRIGTREKELIIVPECSKTKLENEVLIYPGKNGKEKGELAKLLAKRFNIHTDNFLQILPNGRSEIKNRTSI